MDMETVMRLLKGLMMLSGIVILCVSMKIEAFAGGESSVPILDDVDEVNLFTDKEEALIKEAQQKAYEETGIYFDIYTRARTKDKICSQSEIMYSDIFKSVDEDAKECRAIILFYKNEDDVNLRIKKDIDTGAEKYSNIYSDISAYIMGDKEKQSLYADGTSYAGFEAYYVLCCKILQMDEDSVVETWKAETEGRILYNRYPFNTIETSTTTPSKVNAKSIPEKDEGPQVRKTSTSTVLAVVFAVALLTTVTITGTYFFIKRQRNKERLA